MKQVLSRTLGVAGGHLEASTGAPFGNKPKFGDAKSLVNFSRDTRCQQALSGQLGVGSFFKNCYSNFTHKPYPSFQN